MNSHMNPPARHLVFPFAENPPSVCNQPSYLGGNVLKHIHDKTSDNFFGTDFINKHPLQKHRSAYEYRSNEWPLAGKCACVSEPPHRGLNQAQIIDGENSVRMYTTYTVCPGEIDHRYVSQQL